MFATPLRRLLIVLGAMAIAAAACGGTSSEFPDDAFAIRVSSDIGLGRERLLIGIGQPDLANSRLGSPDIPITIEVSPADGDSRIQSVPATFVWILEPVIGLYRAEFDSDRAGTWQATVVESGGRRFEPVLFSVLEEPLAPALGAVAPVAPTPTLDDLPIEELTTDGDPDLRFYQTSLEEAIASGQATVLVFSTPAYCVSAACGPLLDTVKAEAPAHPEVNFIHVEVFTGLTDPDFEPDEAHLAESVREAWYRLPSEPWVFVIDRSGNIAARFEGVMDQAELSDVLEMISL